VDLRVALASYFLQVDRRLENPKLIELKLFEETEASAYRDELTGLYNYRFFSEFLRCEVIRSARAHAPLSLVMIDVDDFKPYNDHGGHETGNVALREIAQLLTQTLHPSDMAARYGGEEFALILPSTPKQGAAVVAERIRASIEEHGFPDQDMQPEGTLTVSMGVATSPGDAGETGELIRCADQALYSAKADGKNRVQLFGQSLRSYQRVKVDIEGSYRLIGSERVPLSCVDLGQGGLCFVATREIEPRALTQVTLDLPGSKRPISLTCEVVDVTPREFGRFLVGSRILNMDANDRRRLCAYISEAESLPNDAPAK
jgi:diguanylate cyclase (GGDEF)-like protein